MNLLDNHVFMILAVLAMTLGAYVALTLTGHGDAAVDLRLPIVALITGAAGAANNGYSRSKAADD